MERRNDERRGTERGGANDRFANPGVISERNVEVNESWIDETRRSWYLGNIEAPVSGEWARRGGLPTGQSEGRYRDPISFGRESTVVESHTRQRSIPLEDSVPRRTIVTFADEPRAVAPPHASTPTSGSQAPLHTQTFTRQTETRTHPPQYPHNSIPRYPESNPPVSQYTIPRNPQYAPPVSQYHHPIIPQYHLPVTQYPYVGLPQYNLSVAQYPYPNVPYHQLPVAQYPYPFIPSSNLHASQRLPLNIPQPNPSLAQEQDAQQKETQQRSCQPTPSAVQHLPISQHKTPAYQQQPAENTESAFQSFQLQQNPITLYSNETASQNPSLTHTIKNPTRQDTATSTQCPVLQSNDGERQEKGRVTVCADRVDRCGTYLRSIKVSFNGVIGDADELLREVRDAADTHGLSDDEVLRVLPYVLEGPALGWFRADRKNCPSYRDFVERFRLNYSVLDSEARIRDQIRERTQGIDEPLANYLRSLQMLFSKLERPVPMEEQLDRACRNLNPKYLTAIDRDSVSSYEELLMKRHKVEETLRLIACYTPPKGPEKSFIPEAAYSGKSQRGERLALVDTIPESHIDAAPPTRPKPTKKKKAQKASTPAATPPVMAPTVPSGYECNGCGIRGHFLRDCPNKTARNEPGNGTGKR